MPSKIIDSRPYGVVEYCKRIATYSFLIKVLSSREFKIKYAKTFLGIGWFFLQPLIVVIIYSVFFNYFVRLKTDDIPYPSFVFSGLVLWYLFTGIINKSTHSLIESSELMNKVYFPRIIILFSKCIPVILECFVLMILAFIVVVVTRQKIGFNAIFALLYFLEVLVFSISLGLLCSIAVLKYRDLTYAIPFVINFGIWLTPVFYSTSIVPDPYKKLVQHGNPLSIAIDGLRKSLFNNEGLSFDMYALLAFTSLLFVLSSFVFIKFEKRIVDNL